MQNSQFPFLEIRLYINSIPSILFCKTDKQTNALHAKWDCYMYLPNTKSLSVIGVKNSFMLKYLAVALMLAVMRLYRTKNVWSSGTQGAFHVNSTPEIHRILPNAMPRLCNIKMGSGESDRLRGIWAGSVH